MFLDTYGPALDGIWGFWPTAIQLNRREAAIRLRKTSVTDDDVAALLREWDRRGVICGVVTDGPNPVSILYRGRRYRAIPPKIKVVNPIGSGDSLLAGLVDGWLERLEPEAAVPTRDRLCGRQRPGLGRRCDRTGRSGAMEQAGCHRAGGGRGPMTNRLFALGRALRLLVRLQDLDQLAHLLEQLLHRFAILLGFLLLLV